MAQGQRKHFQKRSLAGKVDLERLYQMKPDRYPCALISTTDFNSDINRFDILFAFPQQSLLLDHDFVLSTYNYTANDEQSDFLNNFDHWWRSSKLSEAYEGEEPFHGGWYVYLSYELASQIEPSLTLPKPQSKLPVAMAVRCPAAIIHDRAHDQFYAIAENEHAFLLDILQSDFISIQQKSAGSSGNASVQKISEADTADYLGQVNRVKQYIRDGDVFQANLSRKWQLSIDASADDVDLFQQLSCSNPGSFASLLHLHGAAIVSSSPERLVSVRNRVIETRPIAGTRRRSQDATTDDKLADELFTSPKERAEHIMLIDLERNDIGRLCRPGTISVDEFMALESYQHVHHIVSNVRGELRENISPADIIAAVFPGGTITGCPKVRCMQILAEMEREARGAYTGSVGYINRDGSMDLNILIRTMVRTANTVTIRAGGGIVADSDPVAELEETRAKARGLLMAFEQSDKPCPV